MRAYVVINTANDTLNVTAQSSVVFWVPQTTLNSQKPRENFVSAVPRKDTAQSALWQRDGIDPTAELTLLQSGAYVEIVLPVWLVLATFTNLIGESAIDAYWTALYAQINGGFVGNSPIFPSAGQWIGASAVPFTAHVAAGSNGAALPQGTINVDSTASFPAAGTLWLPANQTSGPLQSQIIRVPVSYTAITATSFTGCTGGTGVLFTGGFVTSYTFSGG